MPALTPAGKALGFAVVSLSWLPAAVVVLTLARGLGLPQEAGHWLPLAVSAPCGLPLALAWLALQRAGRRRAAWMALAVLGPLSVLGALAGGVLGPGHRRLYRRHQPAGLDCLCDFPAAQTAVDAAEMTAVVICGSRVRPIARTGPKDVSVMEDVFDAGIAIDRRRRRAPEAWPASGPPS